MEETSGDWLGKESKNEAYLRWVQCLKLNAVSELRGRQRRKN